MSACRDTYTDALTHTHTQANPRLNKYTLTLTPTHPNRHAHTHTHTQTHNVWYTKSQKGHAVTRQARASLEVRSQFWKLKHLYNFVAQWLDDQVIICPLLFSINNFPIIITSMENLIYWWGIIIQSHETAPLHNNSLKTRPRSNSCLKILALGVCGTKGALLMSRVR